MPERYALRTFPINPPGVELEEEGRWIYDQLFLSREYKYAKKRRQDEPGKEFFSCSLDYFISISKILA